jgi:transposase
MPDPDHCTLMPAVRMTFAHLSISHSIRAANSLGVLATPEQQSGLVLHRTRHLLTRQQTAVINAIRAHLAEFGIVTPVGRKGVQELLRVVADGNDRRVLDVVRACLGALGTHTGSV